MMPHPIRLIRIPHGNGWFTFVRGRMITRRDALFILIFGPRRTKIESIQHHDPEHWTV